MKVLVTGATGLVGRKLLEGLIFSGEHEVHVLSRDKGKAQSTIDLPVDVFEWDVDKGVLESEALEGVEAVIHLAGENVAAGRWCERRKREIMESREKGSQLLIEKIKAQPTPPKKLISSSAIGIYGARGDEEIDVNGPLGNDFLAEVCKRWETSILNHGVTSMSAHCIRTGVVLSSEGGALVKMLPAFQMGMGGKLGTGRQFMSWIHIDDLVRQFLFVLDRDNPAPIYNATAPHPVTNAEFTRTLGAVLRRPTVLPVPAFALKVLLGEMSEMLLKGQRVLPAPFLEEGFQFHFPELKIALRNIMGGGDIAFRCYQWVNAPLNEVFSFFSDEKNLERIMPPLLKFQVLSKDTEGIEEGTQIDYRLKIGHVPVRWRSKITEFERGKTFTDEQVIGPYAKWIHQHDFVLYKGGTLLRDKVIYRLPGGAVGKCLAGPWVARDIRSIFAYRSQSIQNFFSCR